VGKERLVWRKGNPVLLRSERRAPFAKNEKFTQERGISGSETRKRGEIKNLMRDCSAPPKAKGTDDT